MLLRLSLIGELSLFDSVLESGRNMSLDDLMGIRYVGALLNSLTGLMLVSDSEPLQCLCDLPPFLLISLVS